MAVGISGLFIETHPDPENALSDGPNSWPIDRMKELLEVLVTIDEAVKANSLIETTL
jgi:2-dehydro-3-deoxyphosphooctonate aldolase (KDO 8-P synthase)